MTAAPPQPYSVRDIMERYESEEDEYLRELEDMRQSLRNSETEDEIPQDPAPILTVLCSLVDEIGSLRTENRRLKTRLAPAPRAKNVVQRMSAMLENRGSALFPRLRRANNHATATTPSSQEVRTGARDRLSTPPRKTQNCMTVSSLSTDVSSSRGPPLVQPELSDSDIDENFNDNEEYSEEHRSRDVSRRCDSSLHRVDHSLSNCTSPSSASSSRDPSEAMTASRSSFLDLFGFRRRANRSAQSLLGSRTPSAYANVPPTKPILKKRKRRISGNDSESSGLYVNMDAEAYRSRLPNKPPRPASYYPREESEDSDYVRCRQRKATSFLNVNANYDNAAEVSFRVDRETRLRHEKDNLLAEIEELKMRNQRLVEQLRDKSQQQSKLQCHLHKVEMQVDTLSRRCALSEAVDRLTVDERMERSATSAVKKLEERLRHFENQMQAAKLEAANAHQMAVNSTAHERTMHQTCLEQLEKLQREHLRLLHSRFLELASEENSLKRRMENMPTYEALYAFTHSIVRRLSEARWALIEKTSEASRTQMDLVATQSSLLVTHAQMERLRICLSLKGRKLRRPSSFHGSDVFERNVRQELNFFLPFKLQGSRVENLRRTMRNTGKEATDRNIEDEFLKLFSYSKDAQLEKLEKQEKDRQLRPASRIEHMIREMNGGRGTRKNVVPVVRDRERTRDPPARRPISLVEVEEQQRRLKRCEDTRRSIKYHKMNSIEQRPEEHQSSNVFRNGCNGGPKNVVASLQDVSAAMSPHGTPILSRRLHPPAERRIPTYDLVPEAPTMRVRKLERGYSTDSKTTDSLHERDDRKSETKQFEPVERRVVRLERSQPVSRMKPPSSVLQMRMRTLDPPPRESAHRATKTLEPPATSSDSRLPNPPSRVEKKSWLDRLKGITRT